jgi:membrane protein DedA with SNARE-associated domain
MRAWRFTLYTLIGALTWDVALTLAGYYLGESWRTVARFMAPISIAIAVALVVFVTWWVVRRVRSRRSSPRGDGDADGDGVPVIASHPVESRSPASADRDA